MPTTGGSGKYIPKNYLTAAENIVFSMPEFPEVKQLEVLTQRIHDNWDEDASPDVVLAALLKAKETF